MRIRHLLLAISTAALLCCSGENLGESEEGRMRIIDVCRQNLALAEAGCLADEAFHFTQCGAAGILIDWDWDVVTGMMLSDVYYSMGHVALAQKLAFEANVCSNRGYEPEAVKRLIQTNIIYGAWDVAEKYICLLEKDRAYRSWATGQRRFLRDSDAVKNDPEYGPRMGCIPENDFTTGSKAADSDLKTIIRTNPEYRKTIEYLGVMYLTDCDFENFRALLDEFYGTKALPALPASFAEAACMMSELEPGYWKKVGVDSGVYRRFKEFCSRMDAGLSLDRFSDSYWYYVKNSFEK